MGGFIFIYYSNNLMEINA